MRRLQNMPSSMLETCKGRAVRTSNMQMDQRAQHVKRAQEQRCMCDAHGVCPTHAE